MAVSFTNLFATFSAILILLGAQQLSAAVILDGTVGDLDDGGKLVGTAFDPSNDTIDLVNEVISGANSPAFVGYNEMFSPAISPATTLIERFEDEGNDGSVEGIHSNLDIDDFNWYTHTDPGGDADATWMGQSLWSISSQDILNYDTLAFEAKAGVDDSTFKYYVAKADQTSAGFTVWSYTSGAINPLYVDADGDLDTKFDARGGKDISHVTIYGLNTGDGPVIIPEPSSYITLSGLLLCLGFAGWWRNKQRWGPQTRLANSV